MKSWKSDLFNIVINMLSKIPEIKDMFGPINNVISIAASGIGIRKLKLNMFGKILISWILFANPNTIRLTIYIRIKYFFDL